MSNYSNQTRTVAQKEQFRDDMRAECGLPKGGLPMSNSTTPVCSQCGQTLAPDHNCSSYSTTPKLPDGMVALTERQHQEAHQILNDLDRLFTEPTPTPDWEKEFDALFNGLEDGYGDYLGDNKHELRDFIRQIIMQTEVKCGLNAFKELQEARAQDRHRLVAEVKRLYETNHPYEASTVAFNNAIFKVIALIKGEKV